MILAFCLSVLVGLLLGALVYVLLTWASRRRATARITQRSKKRSGTSQTNGPASSQMGLYRSTFLSVYRQPSLEPVGPLGSKPGLETSTFRPVPKRSRAGLDMGEDTQVDMPEDTAASTSLDSASLVPNKRHSFWLGGNGLKGFLPSQTPPPAYDSVIHAFEETCTWILNTTRTEKGEHCRITLDFSNLYKGQTLRPSLTLFSLKHCVLCSKKMFPQPSSLSSVLYCKICISGASNRFICMLVFPLKQQCYKWRGLLQIVSVQNSKIFHFKWYKILTSSESFYWTRCTKQENDCLMINQLILAGAEHLMNHDVETLAVKRARGWIWTITRGWGETLCVAELYYLTSNKDLMKILSSASSLFCAKEQNWVYWPEMSESGVMWNGGRL